MKILFALNNVQGPGWDPAKEMVEQDGWNAHRDFINDLTARGFIVLGGLIASDVHEAMLIINAADEAEIRTVFADDPWMISGVMAIKDIRRWFILIDAGWI